MSMFRRIILAVRNFSSYAKGNLSLLRGNRVRCVMFGPDAELPSPAAHIFYDKRVSDAEDPYPKHQGFLRSQIAFLKYLWSARRP